MALSRWKRAVVGATALAITWILSMRLCSHLFYRDPTSFFFDRSRAFDLRYTLHRQEQAQRFMQSLKGKHALVKADNATAPELCVGVASVRRDGIQYFSDTVGSLLAGLDESERRSMHLVLFVAHTEPANHPDWSKGWIEKVADTVLRYDAAGAKLDRIRKMERNRKLFRDKGRLDFGMLLTACAATKAHNVLVVDDDVIAMDGWYHRVVSGMAEADRLTKARGFDEFLYLRLFFTESLLGWNNEEWPLYVRNILMIYAAELVLLALLRRFSPIKQVRESITLPRALLLLAVVTPAAIVFVFAAGRSSMFPPPKGVIEMSEYACCAQGLAFPTARVPEVVGWLDGPQPGFTDSLIEAYARDRGELRWTLSPSVLQHVGSKSSKGVGRATGHPKIINFAFENNDVEALRRDHEAALDAIYANMPN